MEQLTNQPQPPAHNNFPLIVIVALISSALGALGMYGYMSSVHYQPAVAINQSIPTIQSEQPTNTQVSSTPTPGVRELKVATNSANWKTYTSNDASVSFKYPSEWIVDTRPTTLKIKGKEYAGVYISAGKALTEEERKAFGYIKLEDAPKTDRTFEMDYATHNDFSTLTNDNLVDDLIRSNNSAVDDPNIVIFPNKIQALEVTYGCQADCTDVIFRHINTIIDAKAGASNSEPEQGFYDILATLAVK